MAKLYYKVSISGMHIPKGCRKPRRFFESILNMEAKDSKSLEELKAIARIHVSRYSKVGYCNLQVNPAESDGDIESVYMVPVFKVSITKEQSHDKN